MSLQLGTTAPDFEAESTAGPLRLHAWLDGHWGVLFWHDAGSAPVSELRVDGGACVNDLLMQFQADLLGIPVVRPRVIETTALGAAYLAGLSTGVYANTDELSTLWRAERRFSPQRQPHYAAEQMGLWENAVRKTVL